MFHSSAPASCSVEETILLWRTFSNVVNAAKPTHAKQSGSTVIPNDKLLVGVCMKIVACMNIVAVCTKHFSCGMGIFVCVTRMPSFAA